MPTPAEVLGNIAAAIATLTGGTRCWSDIAPDVVDYIEPGTVRFALKSFAVAVKVPNSNDKRPTLGIGVTVFYRLVPGDEERAYTEDERLTHLASLVDPSWWKAIAGVYQEPALPDTSLSDLKRDADDLISYEVTLSVACTTP